MVTTTGYSTSSADYFVFQMGTHPGTVKPKIRYQRRHCCTAQPSTEKVDKPVHNPVNETVITAISLCSARIAPTVQFTSRELGLI